MDAHRGNARLFAIHGRSQGLESCLESSSSNPKPPLCAVLEPWQSKCFSLYRVFHVPQGNYVPIHVRAMLSVCPYFIRYITVHICMPKDIAFLNVCRKLQFAQCLGSSFCIIEIVQFKYISRYPSICVCACVEGGAGSGLASFVKLIGFDRLSNKSLFTIIS